MDATPSEDDHLQGDAVNARVPKPIGTSTPRATSIVATSYATLTFPTSPFDDIIRILMLNGDNFYDWKENILLKLGCLKLDMVLRVDKPLALTESSMPAQILKNEQWEQSNRFCLLFMKSHINKSIQGSIPETDKVKAFLKVVAKQFVCSDKALASTLIKKLSSKTFDSTKGVHEHIMQMRDMAAQLKSLKLEIFESS
ncbi:uncharacterized protein LOC122289273 [Carya illinoinensis]|uniref:uncharacterized protein LOC122289273 n=1 Tax=Carya illinoinensis TaxID=32201 RepID=UPI001C7255AF|nr:uncharacterized protein LOC122289273 [Carya illinoinensis]